MVFNEIRYIVLTIMVITVFGKPYSPLPECPAPEDVYPCTCEVDLLFGLHMDCSLVTSEQQLATVFSHKFQFKNFQSLLILGNKDLHSLPEGSLGEATFEEITINQGLLQVVEPGAFLGSAATLSKLSLEKNNLTAFPFKEISSYERLEKLYLCTNLFNVFPKINSTSLKEFDLADNPVGNPASDAMQGMPNIEMVYLYSCGITEVLTGTFTGLRNLSYLTLADNKLTSLAPYSFELHGPNARLFFTYNNISNPANDSISGITSFINMSYNDLVYLEEALWRPMLESGALMALKVNPLACGCDIAWLIRNEDFMSQIYGQAKCSNGTPIQELDPEDYEMCG